MMPARSRLANRLLATGAGALILFAILLVAARLLLPHAEGLRNTVIERVGETLGVEVEVGELRLRLRGLSPELAFTDARLLAPRSSKTPGHQPRERLLLTTRALRVDLDLIASLAARRPRIEAVTLVGADLQVVRGHDGRIRVLGLDKMQGDDIAALDFFLRQGRFRLLETRLRWRDLSSPSDAARRMAPSAPHAFLIEVAELINDGHSHRLRLRARADADPTGEVQVLADLEGPPDEPSRWSGDLYLGWLGADLGTIGGLLPLDAVRIKSATFSAESWNALVAGRLQRSLTEIRVSDLTVDHQATGRRQQLGELAGLARWQRQPDGWDLAIRDLRLPGAEDTATAARVQYRRAPDVPSEPSTRPAPHDHLARGSNASAVPHASLFVALGSVRLGPIGEALGLLGPDLPDAVSTLVRSGLDGEARGLALHLALEAPRRAASTAETSGGAASAPSPPSRATPPSSATAADPLPTPLATAAAPTKMQPGDGPLSRIADWRLRGELADLQAAPGGGLPAIDGLDLRADLGPRGGSIMVDTEDVDVDLRPLFALPHHFTVLDGTLAWRMMPAGSIHLWTEALRADTANVETLTRLSLCVHPSGTSPFLNLHTRLRDGRIAGLRQWLPAAIMDDRLEDWLERAIVAGRVESGDLVLRGALDQFPFDDNQGRFLLVLRALDGTLDYGGAAQAARAAAAGMRGPSQAPRPSWPPLRDVAATVRFENRRLEIDVPSATILNTQIDAGQARLENLWQPRHLEIRAQGEGPLADGLHVFSTTPLRHQLGGVASAVDVDGRGALRLELGVPLTRGLPFRYNGTLTLEQENEDVDPTVDNPPSLLIKDSDLRFTEIAGELRFGEEGIDADAIQANLGDQEIAVAVQTDDAGTPEARTSIELTGETAVSALATALPSPLSRLVEGALDWRLGLSLRNRDAIQSRPPIDFSLSSDLRGVAVDVPAPLGKAAGSAKRLRLSGRYENQWPLTLNLRYGSLGALLELDQADSDEPELRRAAIDLTQLPAALPPPGRLQITGRLERLRLDPWLQWAQRRQRQGGQRGKAATGLQLMPLQLESGRVELGALRLDAVKARITPEANGGWNVRFSSEQTENGTVRLAAERGREPLTIRLEALDIAPLTAAGADETGAASAATATDPRRVGPIDLEIERLRYEDELLGRLRIASERRPNGLQFDVIRLDGPHVDAVGSGTWLVDATDYVQTTLALTAKSDAAGELLRESGFYSALSGAPGELTLELTWPGAPGDLSLAQARGRLDIEIGAGNMLDLEPGIGRVLGILNTGALRRRLSLDFSDVFEDGFGFDSITGEITVGNGSAQIRELAILAPPADIRISGRTDLVDGVLDQRVEVTPKIGTGLAIAGTVAGGPLVGAAVFLADKVTDGGFERLGRYAYRVEGPWRDPEITRVGTSGEPAVGDLFVDSPAGASSTALGSNPGANPATDAGAPRRQPPSDAERTPDGSSTGQRPQSSGNADDNPFLEGF